MFVVQHDEPGQCLARRYRTRQCVRGELTQVGQQSVHLVLALLLYLVAGEVTGAIAHSEGRSREQVSVSDVDLDAEFVRLRIRISIPQHGKGLHFRTHIVEVFGPHCGTDRGAFDFVELGVPTGGVERVIDPHLQRS
ncbi:MULTISPECIES: hypothetical protein [unclassified Nocardia]|uniref:hypothetical protein n=1 Tax=unclassified Nocardia TaxID=2637762 RepID=UPI00343BB806